jgi:GH15 family glucan-1,4-alpha-glucosidase
MWEVRTAPRQFVYSKVMGWAALDRAIRLGEQRDGVPPEWPSARDEIRATVCDKGYDPQRGVFRSAFGERTLDAALLRIPRVGFVEWDDSRMLRTTDAIASDLDIDGLIRRYDYDDGIGGTEGGFIACSFWLAEALARQGRTARARDVFDRTCATANDVGIFAEEYDPWRQEPRGNLPQAISHLSHLSAAVALEECLADQDDRPS